MQDTRLASDHLIFFLIFHRCSCTELSGIPKALGILCSELSLTQQVLEACAQNPSYTESGTGKLYVAQGGSQGGREPGCKYWYFRQAIRATLTAGYTRAT